MLASALAIVNVSSVDFGVSRFLVVRRRWRRLGVAACVVFTVVIVRVVYGSCRGGVSAAWGTGGSSKLGYFAADCCATFVRAESPSEKPFTELCERQDYCFNGGTCRVMTSLDKKFCE